MVTENGKRVLRKFKRLVSAGAAYDDLEIGPVPDGEQWHIRHVANVDKTTAITSRQVGVKSGGFIYWLLGHTVTTATMPHGHAVEITLIPGESLIYRLTGCTASDVIEAYAVGYYRELGGG